MSDYYEDYSNIRFVGRFDSELTKVVAGVFGLSHFCRLDQLFISAGTSDFHESLGNNICPRSVAVNLRKCPRVILSSC